MSIRTQLQKVGGSGPRKTHRIYASDDDDETDRVCVRGHLFSVVDNVAQSIIGVENTAVRRLELMYHHRTAAVTALHTASRYIDKHVSCWSN